jgi:subtilase family serine protease
MIRSSMRGFAALLAGSLLFAGCGGGGGGSHSVPTTAGGSQTSPQNPITTSGSSSFTWGKQLLQQLAYVGPAKGGGLSVAVLVHMRNAAGLLKYAQDASNPASPTYRHWLTPAQIGAQYGASASDYQTVAKYFASYGLRVAGWPQREALSVSGSTQQFSAAFGTAFGTYTYLGKPIVAPTGTPRFASTLPVDAVVGLMSSVAPRRYLIHNNNASYYGYSPQQIATGFDYSGAYAAGFTGTGIHVGIIGTGPILNASGKDDDTAALSADWKAALAPVTQVASVPQPASSANAGTGTGASDYNPSTLASPPPVTNPNCSQANPNFPDYFTCNPEDGEAQLDTESEASLAPGSSVLFYNAFNPIEVCYNPSTGNYELPTGATCPTAGDLPVQEEGIELSDDEAQQAIADNTADAISMSFGEAENTAEYYGELGTLSSPGIEQIEMASLAAEGIALFASSGDDGAWECFDPATGNPLGTPCVSYPASDPNVVAVGGVNIPLDEGGNLTGAITAWADNTTLGGNGYFGNNVGSGGGVSTVFAAPAWQAATLGVANRVLPDISLDADPDSGPSVTIDSAYGFAPEAVGGTSAASPEAAAQWALVLQACKASSTCNLGGATGYRLGNPSPLLYAIYATEGTSGGYTVGAYAPTGFTPHLTYSQVFYDVTYGNNQAVPAPVPSPATGSAPLVVPTPTGYNSGPGYDQVTGLGAPFTGHLIQAITGTKAP